MKRIIYLLLTIVSFVNIANSQVITILDKLTLKPIENATLSIGNDVLGKSNINGTVDVSNIDKTSLITVLAVGYIPQTFYLTDVLKNDNRILLTEKSYKTEEIVVSADKFAEKLFDVPKQINILTSKEIQLLNVPTTAELLMNTGSVLVQKSQLGGGSPIIRGFEANKVLIVIDGVRLNNAIFRGGHLQNILRIDNNVVERMEVLFGAGSTIYGSDALGGVMNFYTKNPILSSTDKLFYSANLFGRYSTAMEEKTSGVTINLGGKKLGFLGGFTYSNFGDLRMGANYDPTYNPNWLRRYYQERINNVDTMLVNDNPYVQKNSGYYQYDILGKLYFKQTDNIKHTLNIQFSNTGDVPRYDRLNTIGSNGKFTTAQWYYGPETRLLTAYKMDLSLTKSFFDNGQLVLAYQDIYESRHSRSFGKSSLTHRNERVRVYSFNADFQKKISQHELRYGLEANFNDVNSTANAENVKTGDVTNASTRYPDGGSNMKNFAAYLSHSWEINKQLILSDGLRFSYVTLDATFVDTTFYKFPFKDASQRNAALNGNLGLVVMPGNEWRFYLGTSTGFRAPNVDDLSKVFETVKGTATSVGNVIVPNPDLKPEYTWNAELGISKIFDNRIKLEGIAFGTYLTNAIVTGPFKFNGQDTIIYDGYPAVVTANQNSDKGAYILGYTINFNADLTSYFSLYSTLTYTYGRIVSDTSVDYPLDHIPPVYGKTGIVIKLDKFRGEFNAIYNGWKRVADYNMYGEDNFADATPNGMPSWYTLNVSAAYQINKYLQIQAGVDNILDKTYRVFASGINAPGRNFVLTLRAGF
jgi:hemoglobin/transferrin/lactoferrin receptor protein